METFKNFMKIFLKYVKEIRVEIAKIIKLKGQLISFGQWAMKRASI